MIWYGLSAAIWHAVAFDFHPVTLGVPLLMWLIDSADEGRRRVLPVVLAVALALMREDLAVLAGIVLVQAAVLKGRWRDDLVEHPSGVDRRRLHRLGDASDREWVDTTCGPGSRALGAVRSSTFWQEQAATWFGPIRIVSFSAVLFPLLVVPAFMGWKRSWPGLAMMLVNGVASYTQQASLYFQYFAPVVPFLLWGAIASWSRLSQRVGSRAGHRCLDQPVRLARPAVLHRVRIARSLRQHRCHSPANGGSSPKSWRRFPDDVSVSATDFLVPHLARRAEIYPFPGPMVCPESLIFHVDRTSFPAYVAIEWEDAVPGVDWRAFLLESGYEEVAAGDEVSVWKLTGPASGFGPLPFDGGCSS